MPEVPSCSDCIHCNENCMELHRACEMDWVSSPDFEPKDSLEGLEPVDLNYESLKSVLMEAYRQASEGKGKERHASGEAFEHQTICEVARRVGLGYTLGQAVKKTYESKRLAEDSVERGVAELLGAINYLCATVIVMREQVR